MGVFDLGTGLKTKNEHHRLSITAQEFFKNMVFTQIIQRES